MTVSEKIVQSTLLQAVARVAMTLTLPLLLMGVGYIAAIGNSVASHTTDISLLQQAQRETEKWQEAAEKRESAANDRQVQVLDAVQALALKAAETGKDVGYLRDWVEEQKRNTR